MRALCATLLLVSVALSCAPKPSTPSPVVPSAPLVAVPTIERVPEGARSIGEIARPASGPAIVYAYYVETVGPCPPCPRGRHCEPCAPEGNHFSDRADRMDMAAKYLLVEFARGEPSLVQGALYVLDGTFVTRSDAFETPVLRATAIRRVVHE